jgi:hypothetical protein
LGSNSRNTHAATCSGLLAAQWCCRRSVLSRSRPRRLRLRPENRASDLSHPDLPGHGSWIFGHLSRSSSRARLGSSPVIFDRWAEGEAERLHGLAKELIGSQVDALVAVGTPRDARCDERNLQGSDCLCRCLRPAGFQIDNGWGATRNLLRMRAGYDSVRNPQRPIPPGGSSSSDCAWARSLASRAASSSPSVGS